MVTQNAQLVANSIMAEAIENWLDSLEPLICPVCGRPEYEPEELVARGLVLALAEEI